MPNKFVHLHNHSHFSLLDSSSQIKPMVKLAKDLGFPAIALTDHGIMSGSVQLWRECRKENIKPIIGCEIYVSVGDHKLRRRIKGEKHYHHLILLAMNKIGYQNLCKIVSEGYLEGFYYKPRVSYEVLEKYNEGLFCSTACMASELAQRLLKAEDDVQAIQAGREAVETLVNIYGDHIRLELQDHGIPEQKIINERMIKLSEVTNIPLVFTNDCHFLRTEDFEPHKCLKCIQGGENVHTAHHVYKPDHRIKSADEMRLIAKNYPENLQEIIFKAMEETVNVADQIDFNFETGVYHFPEVRDSDESVHNQFQRACFEGFEQRAAMMVGDKGEEYAQRLLYEMKLISEMGFESYFLIVSDIINWCKNNNIPVGPGRGSAAGSLVSYCLNITDIDPIKHGLLFERFLNPARISMPDIDIDFSKRHRHRVIEYTVNKYGRDNVAQIITFGTLKPRAGLRDIARVHGWPVEDQNRLSALIPHSPGKPYNFERAEEELPEVKRALKDPKTAEIWEIAKSLEENNRNAGIHAAGVVITPEPVVNYAPLFKQSGGEDVAAAYDMHDLEEIGLVKMDYLGLKTLDLIQDCIKLVPDDIDILHVPLDDEQVIKLFAYGETKGVFQFESPGIRQAIAKLRPTEFEHIVAMNALYRPGPLDSGMTDQFISRKNGDEEVEALHPDIEDILSTTFGVIVYQEQVMETVRKLGGFSLADADIMRKAMGKKNKELMEKELNKFIEAGIQRGYLKEDMEKVGEAIQKFARYGFNKAHATAYSFIAYQTAWLKTYYPVEFMCALLTNEAEDKKPEKVQEYIGDAKRMGIQILPPDVNYSGHYFDLEKIGSDVAIRYGLAGIRNVGEGVAQEIVEERKANGPFKSFPDFINRMPMNKKILEGLIYAGATMSLGGHPAEHYHNFPKIIESKKRGGDFGGQTSFLDEIDEYHLVIEQSMEQIDEWEDDLLSTCEKEALGLWLEYHPLNAYKDQIEEDIVEARETPGSAFNILAVITDVVKKSSQKGTKFAVITLEDLSGSTSALMFGHDKLEEFKGLLEINKIVQVEGNTKAREGDVAFYINKLSEPEDID